MKKGNGVNPFHISDLGFLFQSSLFFLCRLYKSCTAGFEEFLNFLITPNDGTPYILLYDMRMGWELQYFIKDEIIHSRSKIES